MTGGLERIAILAPNWLGDAVMALPAIADVRRSCPAARITVAARPGVAGLFTLVDGVDDVITIDRADGQDGRDAVPALAAGAHQASLLLPNSFRAAWLAWRARIPHRWGYRGDGRSWLLTIGVPRVARTVHQVEYYQHLTRAVGIASGSHEPRIDVGLHLQADARARLREKGCDERSRLVVLAPGAAYGTAKQWVPEHVSSLLTRLVKDDHTCAVVGSRGDAPAAAAILGALPPASAERVIDLTGETTLAQLAAILSVADACVSNDSGAMHLAAAVGTPLVATFGPTDERVTAPTGRPGTPAVVLTHDVWCRPCMLRECPIDHSCMTGLTPDRVHEAVLHVAARAHTT